MRARRLLLAVLVVGGCAGSGAVQREGGGARSAGQHPRVDVGLSTCSQCHATATPVVAARWRDGHHGLALVECVVCHGSTGADFKARPGTTACIGCHAEQVQTATAGCFACHEPHALHPRASRSPHAAGSSR